MPPAHAALSDWPVKMNASAPILELTGISKSFGGVAALNEVDFALRPHEIHGLVGQNGAGKSTLMKIIAGVHTTYEGDVRVDGAAPHFASTRDARAAGVGMVYQELSIVPDLTVAENVLLGQQPTGRLGVVDWRRMFREADEHLRGLGLAVDPRARTGSLPIGIQQLVEISRVLFSGARIIILDEPTSALSPPEVEHLFEVLRRLRDSGRSIVFISHFIDDVLKISDVVTVFRNGRKIFSQATEGLDKQKVIEQMIGGGHDKLADSYTGDFELRDTPNLPVVLETERLSLGRAYGVPAAFVQKLNPKLDERNLRPRTGIKIVQGPFHARLIKHAGARRRSAATGAGLVRRALGYVRVAYNWYGASGRLIRLRGLRATVRVSAPGKGWMNLYLYHEGSGMWAVQETE